MRKRKRYSAAERAQLLERGLKRIEDLASGRVKGLTEKQLRRELRKRSAGGTAGRA